MQHVSPILLSDLSTPTPRHPRSDTAPRRAGRATAVHTRPGPLTLAGLVLGVVGALASGPAAAATTGSWLTGGGLVIGGAVGSTDYGTGFKGQVGSGGTGLQLGPVPGLWRWEAQLQSFGSENYVQFGSTFKRSAWSLGASLMPQLPLLPGVNAYAKLGLHYLSSHASGPGLSTTTSGFKPGIGAGLRWQAHPRIGVRLEYENIGSSGGDVVSVGVEMPF
ncbi:MAG: hypothetical protein RL375_357 [Pseudomonadota bacterium]